MILCLQCRLYGNDNVNVANDNGNGNVANDNGNGNVANDNVIVANGNGNVANGNVANDNDTSSVYGATDVSWQGGNEPEREKERK